MSSTPTGTDPTRKERREAARARRRELEEAARAREIRRKRMTQLGVAIAAVAAIVIIAVIALGSGGSKSSSNSASNSSGGSGANAGLSTGPAPWPPEYNNLATRLQNMSLPAYGEAMGSFHIHAHLDVFVDGKPVTVPANVGIDPQGQFLAPVHTHDATGVIHMESGQPFSFTLGDFFRIWGVRFTATQLGGYTAGNGNVLQTYVNGKPIANPPAYGMNSHDLIVVGYGKPGSFPKSYQYSFAAGL